MILNSQIWNHIICTATKRLSVPVKMQRSLLIIAGPLRRTQQFKSLFFLVCLFLSVFKETEIMYRVFGSALTANKEEMSFFLLNLTANDGEHTQIHTCTHIRVLKNIYWIPVILELLDFHDNGVLSMFIR